MKAVVAAFNQEKALVGAFSVITNLRMEIFEALSSSQPAGERERRGNGILNFVKILNQNFSRVTNLNKEETWILSGDI